MAPLALGLMLSAAIVPMAGAFVANPAAFSIAKQTMGDMGGEWTALQNAVREEVACTD